MTIGGFVFNNQNSNDLGIKVLDKKRPILSGYNDGIIKIPGRHGTYLYPGELQDKVFEIECLAQAATVELLRQKMREIAAWLNTTDRQQLSFLDEPNIFYMAKLESKIDPDQINTSAKFTVSFRAEPLAYGADIEQNFVNGLVTVNNPGTFEAMPLFQLTFTAIANEVKIELGGKFIRVLKAFAIGDILEINTATGAVLLNSVRILNALDWQYSTFFTIPKGEFNIYLSKPATGVNAKVIYRPRYL